MLLVGGGSVFDVFDYFLRLVLFGRFEDEFAGHTGGWDGLSHFVGSCNEGSF